MGAPGDGPQGRRGAVGRPLQRRSVMEQEAMAYIIVTVSFQCPSCHRTSGEQLIAEAPRFDREQMARTLSQQPFDCQFCLRTLPNGTPAMAHAELATPDQLLELGLPSSRAN